MVSKKSFTLLVASRTTPFFVVVQIFLSRIVGLESLSDRRWYRRLCLFWKIVNGKNPIYLKERIPNIQFSNNTERNKLFSKMRYNNDYYGNTFSRFVLTSGTT